MRLSVDYQAAAFYDQMPTLKKRNGGRLHQKEKHGKDVTSHH